MRGAKATLLGVIAACLFGWSVQAQTTDANVSPARLALAQKLVEVGKFDRAMTLAIDAVLRPFIQQINAGSAPPEMKTYTILLLKSETAEMEARITPKVAEIYAAEFTDQQLQDILAFYQSPTGQALVAKQPELSAVNGRSRR